MKSDMEKIHDTSQMVGEYECVPVWNTISSLDQIMYLDL